jgi:hypothetical protein
MLGKLLITGHYYSLINRNAESARIENRRVWQTICWQKERKLNKRKIDEDDCLVGCCAV